MVPAAELGAEARLGLADLHQLDLRGEERAEGIGDRAWIVAEDPNDDVLGLCRCTLVSAHPPGSDELADLLGCALASEEGDQGVRVVGGVWSLEVASDGQRSHRRRDGIVGEWAEHEVVTAVLDGEPATAHRRRTAAGTEI